MAESTGDNRKHFFYYTKENRTSELMFSQRILSVSEGVLLVGLIEDFALVGGSWVIRANKNKMAAACKPVVLAKLICFGIVCGFSLAKRKIDIKNDSLKNIGNYSDVNRYRKELSSTTTLNVRGECCICDHGKTLGGFP